MPRHKQKGAKIMMSEQEKQYIVEQRASGKSFAEIGRSLGKNADTVRSVFNRIMEKEASGSSIVAQPQTSVPNVPICKYCGQEFARTSEGAKRLFCSDHCRNAYHNGQKRRVPYALTCEYCGRRFIAFGNPRKRFCRRKCFADSQKKAVALAGSHMEAL